MERMSCEITLSDVGVVCMKTSQIDGKDELRNHAVRCTSGKWARLMGRTSCEEFDVGLVYANIDQIDGKDELRSNAVRCGRVEGEGCGQQRCARRAVRQSEMKKGGAFGPFSLETVQRGLGADGLGSRGEGRTAAEQMSRRCEWTVRVNGVSGRCRWTLRMNATRARASFIKDAQDGDTGHRGKQGCSRNFIRMIRGLLLALSCTAEKAGSKVTTPWNSV